MNKLIFQEYIFMVMAAYAVRFIVTRVISFIKPVNNFYKKRQIFPAVKIWNNKFALSIYNEFFGILEVSMITIIYMLAQGVISTEIVFFKGLIFFIFYEAVTVTTKVKFTLISSEYPASLLIFEILTSSITVFFECIVIACLYG